jgi:hypothetical protein
MKRDSGPHRRGSKHSVLNSLRRNLRGSVQDDGQQTSPTRYSAADAAEDDYTRFLHRGH